MLPLSFIRISKTNATRLQRLQNRFHCLLCGKDCKKKRVSLRSQIERAARKTSSHFCWAKWTHFSQRYLQKSKIRSLHSPTCRNIEKTKHSFNQSRNTTKHQKSSHEKTHAEQSLNVWIYLLSSSFSSIYILSLWIYVSVAHFLNISSCVLSFNVILLYRPTVYCLLCLSQCCQSLIVIFFRINTNYYYYYFFVFLVKTNTPFSWRNNHKPGCIVYT